MTSFELNAKLAVLVDEIAVRVERFQALRDEAPDEVWDEACEQKPWSDTLCDIEYELETAIAQA